MYNATSPYYETKLTKSNLGMMVDRPIPKYSDDISFEINSTYHNRPDLLAHDLYGESDLWWVFAARNPNTIKNPLYDFAEGTSIKLPKLEVLKQVLGF